MTPGRDGAGGDEPWPTAFVVGAQKAGTTSLYHYLGQHPDVYASPTKEPHFFSDYKGSAWTDDEPDPAARREYLDLFRDAPAGALRMEASASYLCDPAAPRRIAGTVPDARAVASLRDPVKRAHSHYLMNVRGGDYDRPLVEMLRDLDRDADGWRREWAVVREGFYADALERYVDALGRDRIHVLLVDDLGEDPVGALREVATFLGIDPDPMAEVDHDLRFNPYGEARNPLFRWLRTSDAVRSLARRLVPVRLRRFVDNQLLLETEDKPGLDPEARRILQEIYADDVRRVEAILDRDLPELRASWT